MRRICFLFVLLGTAGLSLATDWSHEDESSSSEEYDYDSSEVSNDYCMGDMEGLLIDGTGMNCSGYVEKYPSTCYVPEINAWCCHSCEIIFVMEESARKGCEYGNRDENWTFVDDVDGTTFKCADVAKTKQHACAKDDVVKRICCGSCYDVLPSGKVLEGDEDSDEDF